MIFFIGVYGSLSAEFLYDVNVYIACCEVTKSW